MARTSCPKRSSGVPCIERFFQIFFPNFIFCNAFSFPINTLPRNSVVSKRSRCGFPQPLIVRPCVLFFERSCHVELSPHSQFAPPFFAPLHISNCCRLTVFNRLVNVGPINTTNPPPQCSPSTFVLSPEMHFCGFFYILSYVTVVPRHGVCLPPPLPAFSNVMWRNPTSVWYPPPPLLF